MEEIKIKPRKQQAGRFESFHAAPAAGTSAQTTPPTTLSMRNVVPSWIDGHQWRCTACASRNERPTSANLLALFLTRLNFELPPEYTREADKGSDNEVPRLVSGAWSSRDATAVPRIHITGNGEDSDRWMKPAANQAPPTPATALNSWSKAHLLGTLLTLCRVVRRSFRPDPAEFLMAHWYPTLYWSLHRNTIKPVDRR